MLLPATTKIFCRYFSCFFIFIKTLKRLIIWGLMLLRILIITFTIKTGAQNNY